MVIAPRRPAQAALAGHFSRWRASPSRSLSFIDWQNTYKTAREAFGWRDYPNEYGNYSPFGLSRLLAAGNERGADAALFRVNVHRGLPSSKYDQQGYAANRRQAAAWMKESPELVIPRLRPLRYSRDRAEPPREKGIDVEPAVAAVEWSLTGRCDVAIIFSHDTDILPAIELIGRLKGSASVETASWTSETFNRRLRASPPVHHHTISQAVFDTIETRINYAHGR